MKVLIFLFINYDKLFFQLIFQIRFAFVWANAINVLKK